MEARRPPTLETWEAFRQDAVQSRAVATSSKRERERWARNERVRRRVLERDRTRPAAELLAETIAVSASAMKLRAAARHRSR